MGDMMKIHIEEMTKIRIARSGPVLTFGDYDSRTKLKEPELALLFDDRWEPGLRRAVEESLPCEFEVAKARLQGKQMDFIDPNQEHRQFRFQSMEFIVQFDSRADNSKELTQLWKVQSGDDHPKTLFVTFETVAERKHFKAISDHLRKHDENLGLEILRDFISKFDVVLPPSDQVED